MENYDIIMLVVLVGAILFGAIRGLAWQIASLSALFLSYFVALNFYKDLAPRLQAESPWNNFLAMLLLYLGTSLAIWIAFGMVRKVIDRVKLKDFDRHLGAVLGAFNGAILCLIITLFAVTLLEETQKEAICRSKSGYIIARAIDKLRVGMPADVHKVVKPLLDKLDDNLHEGEHDDDDADRSKEDALQSGSDSGLAFDSLKPPIVSNGYSENYVESANTLFNQLKK